MTWLRDVLERARALGIGEGYISVVGSPDELGEAEAQVIASASHASATVPILSSMRQTKLQGYQKTIVLGTDPAMDIGAAETFIAICLATAGRDAIVPATIRRHRLNGTMQLSRGLKEGSPALIWQTIAQEDHSASLLEHCLDAVAHYRVLQNPDALIRTMRFARTNLARPWRSPFELARTLTQYEVMGWDGRLVRLPEDMLARVEEAGIERALAALIQPLNEVLGRR
ncbi:hypothetical protein J2Y69_002525 [Microbacterium resistens]|uniref:Uncharacterized protein n=1 Tax=Microbacterium resistens TaxID=156977 RepID=A0ABU1SEC3_9MICO|nr:hypothetical protein [Microbacterium resistens]MDR6867917.1 hypothetical protein [Microbacterium resistens]